MYFNFSIRSPWKDKAGFKNYFLFHRPISKNKHIEIQASTDSWNIASFEFKIGFREDHAGISLTFGFIGKELSIRFYDTRHWDYKNNSWQENA